jgi:hypothetical protein
MPCGGDDAARARHVLDDERFAECADEFFRGNHSTSGLPRGPGAISRTVWVGWLVLRQRGGGQGDAARQASASQRSGASSASAC